MLHPAVGSLGLLWPFLQSDRVVAGLVAEGEEEGDGLAAQPLSRLWIADCAASSWSSA
jgi:hypothetical protein